jgi:hypothetical protein
MVAGAKVDAAAATTGAAGYAAASTAVDLAAALPKVLQQLQVRLDRVRVTNRDDRCQKCDYDLRSMPQSALGAA